MKIINSLLLLTLSLTCLELKKHHKYDPSGESNSDEQSVEEDSEYGDQQENVSFFESFDSKCFLLNLNGTLRQIFSIVTAFEEPKSNVVCSPVSALLPLGKLALGAEGEGLEELLEMVGEPNIRKLSKSFKKLIKRLRFIPGVELNLASRIYVSDRTEVCSKFAQESKHVFRSGIERVSFKDPQQTVDEINGWVARQTKGMIPLLLTPNQIPTDISMLLVNAIYFKGKWRKPFDKVRVGDFNTPSGIQKAQFMSQENHFNYTKCPILNAQIIQIPYEGFKASFVIVLPNEANGLPLLLSQLKLAPNLLNEALKNLVPTWVSLTIPKFKIATSLDLKDIYEKIGITHVLRPKSGLTEIVEKPELWISSAIQKAVIEVHERGTEAAAASAVSMVALSGHVNTIRFRADRPFLFYVQCNDEQLFAGIYNGAS